jgi:hypothetical protein
MGLLTVRTLIPIAATMAVLATPTAGPATAAGLGVPKPPDGAVLLSHHHRWGTYSAEYRIKDTTPRAVARHYRKAFEARGYSIRFTQKGPGYYNLYMKRSGLRSFVGAGRAGGGRVYFEVCRGTNHLEVDVCS